MAEIEYCDEAFHDLSIMLHSDTERPTFRSELLVPKHFDYSLESLDHLERYLMAVREDKDVELDWNRTVLRCGAYVGEVIRSAKPNDNWHWVDYATVRRLNPRDPTFEQQSIANTAVLTNWRSSYWFPLGKVYKFLENGPEDSVKAFAAVAIDQPASLRR